MEPKKISRRNFLGKSTVAAGGMVTVGAHGTKTGNADENIDSKRLPREVWIASVSQMGFRTETSREMVDKVLPALNMLTTKAWQNKYVVVSSTNKNKSKICDISGEIIDQTNIWNPNLICGPFPNGLMKSNNGTEEIFRILKLVRKKCELINLNIRNRFFKNYE